MLQRRRDMPLCFLLLHYDYAMKREPSRREKTNPNYFLLILGFIYYDMLLIIFFADSYNRYRCQPIAMLWRVRYSSEAARCDTLYIKMRLRHYFHAAMIRQWGRPLLLPGNIACFTARCVGAQRAA